MLFETERRGGVVAGGRTGFAEAPNFNLSRDSFRGQLPSIRPSFLIFCGWVALNAGNDILNGNICVPELVRDRRCVENP